MSGKHLRRHHKDRTSPGSDNRKARVDYERKRRDLLEPEPEPEPEERPKR